jgi:hypothetical protein
MSKHPRNLLLLQQIPESNPFKKLAPRAFDIGDDYEKDRESIFGKDERGVELRRDLSPEGKRDEAQKAIRRAIRDLRDLQKPLDEFRSKTAEMNAAAKKLPAFDKTDIVGAMNRREIRDASRAMTFGQRAAKLSGSARSVAFIDAVLEHVDDPWMSGIDIFNPNELQVFEEAKQSRLQDIHGPLLSTIAAREAVESEALMVANVVLGDLAADSRLDPREFEAEVKHVESGTGSVWLKRSTDANGHEVIYELVPEGGGFRGQIASPDALQNGHFFASHEEYLAARAA